MANDKKCAYCNKKIKVEPYIVKISNKNVHYCNENCAKEHDKQKKDRVLLLNYIQEIYLLKEYDKEKIPFPMLSSQISNMMATNKSWTYSQILYTLKYMNEIININLFDDASNGSILSLLPFYFQEAKEFCLQIKEINKSVRDFDFKEENIVIKTSNYRESIDKIKIEDL